MVDAKVNLWNKLVGVVVWDTDKKIAYFEFDGDFIKTGLDIAPLTMPMDTMQKGKTIFSFPLLPVETFKGLPGVLADSLPDRFGTLLLDVWLQSRHRDINSFSPVERLCYMGKRGMGALEYEPAIHPKNKHSSHIEVSEMVELVNNVINQKGSLNGNIRNSINHAISKIIQVGTSAGGARPKAIISYNQKTGEIRSGQAEAPDGFSHWIIKLDGVSEDGIIETRGFGRIEYAYYKMATDCGIKMAECNLLEENSRAHFITKRFDRTASNEKYHMQTLCAIAHFDYNNPNAYSYEQAFQIMRELRLPYPDAEQLFTRMVFNDIAKNNDDHTKNISFLMNKNGDWALSPAYDVTFSYNPASMWLQRHQLSINGKRENITDQDLLFVARQMSIKKPNEIIEKVKETVNHWKDYAKECNIDKQQTDYIEQIIHKSPR